MYFIVALIAMGQIVGGPFIFDEYQQEINLFFTNYLLFVIVHIMTLFVWNSPRKLWLPIILYIATLLYCIANMMYIFYADPISTLLFHGRFLLYENKSWLLFSYYTLPQIIILILIFMKKKHEISLSHSKMKVQKVLKLIVLYLLGLTCCCFTFVGLVENLHLIRTPWVAQYLQILKDKSISDEIKFDYMLELNQALSFNFYHRSSLKIYPIQNDKAKNFITFFQINNGMPVQIELDSPLSPQFKFKSFDEKESTAEIYTQLKYFQNHEGASNDLLLDSVQLFIRECTDPYWDKYIMPIYIYKNGRMTLGYESIENKRSLMYIGVIFEQQLFHIYQAPVSIEKEGVTQ